MVAAGRAARWAAAAVGAVAVRRQGAVVVGQAHGGQARVPAAPVLAAPIVTGWLAASARLMRRARWCVGGLR